MTSPRPHMGQRTQVTGSAQKASTQSFIYCTHCIYKMNYIYVFIVLKQDWKGKHNKYLIFGNATVFFKYVLY
jgi:hypothetical protein